MSLGRINDCIIWVCELYFKGNTIDEIAMVTSYPCDWIQDIINEYSEDMREVLA